MAATVTIQHVPTDFRPAVKELLDQGWKLANTGGRHWMAIEAPNGRKFRIPSSPGASRTVEINVARWKREGGGALNGSKGLTNMGTALVDAAKKAYLEEERRKVEVAAERKNIERKATVDRVLDDYVKGTTTGVSPAYPSNRLGGDCRRTYDALTAMGRPALLSEIRAAVPTIKPASVGVYLFLLHGAGLVKRESYVALPARSLTWHTPKGRAVTGTRSPGTEPVWALPEWLPADHVEPKPLHSGFVTDKPSKKDVVAPEEAAPAQIEAELPAPLAPDPEVITRSATWTGPPLPIRTGTTAHKDKHVFLGLPASFWAEVCLAAATAFEKLG